MEEQQHTENKRSLDRAIRDVRIADVEQSSVVVELGDTERARLEILHEALEDVAKELPEDMEMLTFQIVPGRKPRFWIDITSFVEMARDKRTYRFLKDTRLGRVVLAQSQDVDDVADSVTHYLAERIIEREKAIESDYLLNKMSDKAINPKTAALAKRSQSGGSNAIWWFLCGILAGAIGLVLYAWFLPTNF
ncbi:hypothetical protein SAMN04488056_106237 [Cohaesibacter marisflavi]|uniref:Uncharacterized protein n=1 Tax=Cohaesibacter marisflavi TaxID=655353 RepID=A0A1I5HHA2_9HYPH|nr:hypothetical protein [Cohaesibacter marisflavi]SFO47645.1 hypothetical protein SAMN04488056_106237 [Cohaesibacter marisflavi]